MSDKLIHLILDTNIFRSDILFKKAEFKALERLLESGEVILHVPYIVFNEFVSYQINKYEEIKFHFEKNLNDLARFGFIPEESKKIIKKFLVADYKKEINKDFTERLLKYKAKIYSHINCNPMDIFKDYFDGSKAFKSLKNKEDIPDSFLYYFVLDFIKKHLGAIYFISNDSHLKKVLKEIDGLIIQSSLKEFIEAKHIQGYLYHIDYTDKVSKFLKKAKSDICDFINNSIVDMLSGKQIEDPIIPSDDNLAYICSVSEVANEDDLNLDFKTLHYYGDNLFVINCDFIIYVEGHIDIFKPDYIGEEMSFSVVAEENDHYYTTSVEIQIRIKSGIQIKIQYFPEDENQIEIESVAIDSID